MKVKQIARASLVGLGTIIMCSSIAFGVAANSFHSAANGYSVAIPVGWIQIPDSTIREMSNSVMSAEGRSRISYEAGFQSGTASRWFDYPYVLIQILRYSDFGLSGQIPKSQFANLVRAISGSDPTEITETFLSGESQKIASDFVLGRPYLDTQNNRFGYGLTIHVANVGRVRGAIAGHFGKYGIIQIAYYDRECNWIGSKPERDFIFASFAFDATMGYDDTYAAEGSLAGHLGEGAVKGLAQTAFLIVVGSACALFVTLRQVRRRRKQNTPESTL